MIGGWALPGRGRRLALLAPGMAVAVVGLQSLAATGVLAASSLSLSPSSGPAQTTFTATFTFDPSPGTCDSWYGNTTVSFTWDGVSLGPPQHLHLGSTCAATLTAQPPASDPSVGNHTVTATASSTTSTPPSYPSASAAFTVTGTSPAPRPGGTPPATPSATPSATAAVRGHVHVSVAGPGTVTSAPVGVTCPAVCDAAFAAGTQVVLTESSTGATFTGWGGACASAATSPTCSLTTAAGDVAVTAGFTAQAGPTPPAAPAAFTVATNAPALRESVFVATPPSGPVGVASYQWDFENGAGDMTCPPAAPVAYHLFRAPGTYAVTLTQVDVLGRSTTTTSTLTVAGHASLHLPASAAFAGACATPPSSGSAQAGCVVQVDVDGAVAEALDGGCFAAVPVQVRAAARSHTNLLTGAPTTGGASQADTVQDVVVDHGAPPPVLADAQSGPARPGVAGSAAGVVHPTAAGPLGTALNTMRGTWVCTCAVRLDGLDIQPGGGDSDYVLVSDATNTVYSPSATVTIAGSGGANGGPPLTLAKHVELNRVLPDVVSAPHHVVNLGSFGNIGRYLPHLFGFSLLGTAKAYIINGTLQVEVHVELPDILSSDSSGDPITGDATLIADNQQGLHLQNLDIEVPDAFLGAVELQKVHITYDAGKDLWDAGGSLYVIDEATVSGDVGFRHGRFDHGSASLAVQDPGIGLFPPLVYLNEIDFSISEGPPLVLSGHIRLTAGGQVSTPFGDASAAAIDGTLTFTDSDPWTLDADGSLSIVGLSVANGHIRFVSSGDLSFDGSVHLDAFNLGILVVDGNVGGGVYGDGSFDVDDSVNVCVLWKAACGGGEFVISSKGLGACLEVGTLVGSIHIGGGYTWGGGLKVMWDSCGLGDWQVGPPPQGAADTAPGAPPAQLAEYRTAASQTAVVVPPGVPQEVIGVTGSGGPPRITLTGPDGESLTTTPGAMRVDGRFVVLTSPHDSTTYVAIAKPPAGTWTISAAPGSTPISGVRYAAGHDTPAFTASVTSGDVLQYRWTPQPGVSVRFLEVGPTTRQVIGSAGGATGSIHFTPGDGTAGDRQIVAEITQDGLPWTTQTIATYRASGRALPARPAHLTAHVDGSTLVVGWDQVPRARRYAARVTLDDGRSVVSVVDATNRTLRVEGLFPGEHGRVTIAGLLADDTAGPAAVIDLPLAVATAPAAASMLGPVVGVAAVLVVAALLASALVLRRRVRT